MFEKSKRSLAAATRGGTYRVHDSSAVTPGPTSLLSLASNRQSRPKFLSITVVFLDDSQQTFEVEKYAKGSVLLEKVYQHLELIERDYFGLQFDELLPPPEVVHPLSSPHLRWIESSKALKKQIRFTKPTISKKSSLTTPNGGPQQHFNGNGHAASSKPSSSAGFIPTQHGHSPKDSVTSASLPTATVYFRVKFFVEDPSRLNEEYTRYHIYLQLRKDIMEGRLAVTPSTACLLASYAIQSELGDFNEDDHDDYGYYLKNFNTINLSEISFKVGEEYLRKITQLHKLHKGQTPADAEFNYLDQAKRLDAYGVAFHRVKDNAGKEIQVGVSASGIAVYHNGIKINTFSWSKITKIAFKRKHFFIQLRREQSEEYDTLLMFDCFQYRSCKLLWKSCVEHHAFFRLSAPPPPNRRSTLLLLTLGSKFRYSGRTEYQTREDTSFRSQSRERERERRTFFRSPSKKLLLIRQTLRGKIARPDPDIQFENGTEPADITAHSMSQSQESCYSQPRPSKMHRSANIMNLKGAAGSSLRANDKVQSYAEKEPRKAWGERSPRLSDDEGGFLDNRTSGMGVPQPPPLVIPATHIPLPTRGIAFADDDENSQSDDGTVSIRLEPDHQGKFGFNVKGGSDMGCPVLVSRVAPGTPADQCYPRLTEGDQLIQINGKDTMAMPHREVVTSIRHAATIRKELCLRVRQNVYTTDDYEEPAFQYVPDVPSLRMATTGHGGDVQSPLASSMLLLAEAIESDSISSQFELVFRRKPGLSCDVAKLPENIAKNRYRDISPYDSTRVVLLTAPTGDYVNANYVTMEIPASGVVNRYIASQGPLSSTCIDFWLMVWETQSPLIVMLTPVCERGRVKCHPYWPQHLNSSVLYHNVQVKTIEETILPHWIRREFQLKHTQTGEERHVVQLQFQSWPDHGVPDDPISFIKFVEEVRKAKLGTVEPTIVHCSAGIGRTGVLILMETAECLIEANQPVFPLEIVQQMRNQRPLMIQTPSQYRFVCLCALRVYQQGLIRPSSEFTMVSTSPTPLFKSIFGRKNPFSNWGQN